MVYQCELKSVGMDGMGLTCTTAPLYLSTGGVRGTKLETSVAAAIEEKMTALSSCRAWF
jgi:hypothetical protein